MPFTRWERTILIGASVGVLIAGWTLVSTLRIRARVHKAAVVSLSNYAAVAMEQYVNGYESILRQSFVPMLDSLGRPLERLDPMVAAAVRPQADSLSRVGWRYAFQVIPTRAGTQFVFFTLSADSASGRHPHGFTVPAAQVVERVFQPAFQSARLIPRHLLATMSRNDQFLSLALETRDGQELFSTAPAYPDGPTDALNLPVLRGGFVVRAHLNPAIKDALIPGGIPPRVPAREVGLIGLSLGLLIAIALLGLRVSALARLRSDLASSVTHELRTPLTQIRLAAETVLLGRSRSAESERRSLASIVDEAKRLQQLIDNVLHFSRAERQMTRVQAEPVELRPVVERAACDLAPLVADRGILLQVQVPEQLVVRGDANALRQITLNLLDNAARYGPDGQPIEIGAHARDGKVELWVEDRGPGIPAAERKRVWEAFIRLDRDRESAVTGTGLGLAVVRELVEAQGGRCWIEEGASKGARVVVQLAREPAHS
jgi:signal transduction histidine kinase